MPLRPEAGSVPDEPGSYQFKDKSGRITYVGKAKSLRNRLNSYFQDAKTSIPARCKCSTRLRLLNGSKLLLR